MREVIAAAVAGTLFGAGLAVSGMADPARVSAFLDVAGAWDPTLAFVLAGAILPMALAWRLRAGMSAPLAAQAFDLPGTTGLDRRLVAGALIFGAGWGLAGLCPGPAIAGLVLEPLLAGAFVAAMAAGMVLHRLTMRPAGREGRRTRPSRSG